MRTHYCGELTAAQVGESVSLAGWVHTKRDHGGLIFIDLRDRAGFVQLVVHPEEQPEAFTQAEKLRSEFVVLAHGTVVKRKPGAENTNIPTGEIEVDVSRIELLNESETPPFPIEDGIPTSEEVRLRHRYLDLRRPEMNRILQLRHRTTSAIRSYFDERGFIEVETPLLTKATPEGARDFLVPSRLQPGKFFALPQSPQLYKQLLMIAGVDRYYQIARCFRDEDPRSDRHQDFTQLDVELSFTSEEEVMHLTELLFARIWKEILNVDLELPFPSLKYADSLARYGTDKPDLRFGLEMTDVTRVFETTQIRVFRSTLDKGGAAIGVAVPGAAGMSRRELDQLTVVARNLGAGGLAWVALQGEKISSPLEKFLREDEVRGLVEATGAERGDLILVVCDRPQVAQAALGAVRLDVADRLSLRPASDASSAVAWKFAWITDTPLVEWNEKENRWDSVHHPFTAPKVEDEPRIETDPGSVRAQAYDIVLNGWEMGGGSIRIHRPDLQKKIFDLIGMNDDTVQKRFGWFLEALRYGVPPHGGIAPGIDRIVAKLAGKDTIREVIAFPKTGAYSDALTGAPYAAEPEQLRDLHIKVVE